MRERLQLSSTFATQRRRTVVRTKAAACVVESATRGAQNGLNPRSRYAPAATRARVNPANGYVVCNARWPFKPRGPMTLASFWTQTARLPTYPALKTNAEAGVAIIGGGIAGLTAALKLQRAGKDVVVLEARHIGSGETGQTTAHLTELLDERYSVLESKFGREGARLAAESSRAAIATIEDLSKEFGSTCDFSRVPAFLYAETDEQSAQLKREVESLTRVGATVTWHDSIPLRKTVAGAIRLDNQAQFHPLRYLAQMAAAFVRAGGRIYENSEVLSVQDGEPCRVMLTGERVVSARSVLVLAHVPVTNRVVLHTKISAYRSYAIAARTKAEFPIGLYWDMNDPYHYTRRHTSDEGTFVIVGGEDHKTGQQPDTQEAYAALERFMKQEYGLTDIAHRWSGQIIEPVDGLPFIGKNPGENHVYIATGFSGTGMTFGTVAGMLLSDLVRGVANSWAELYSPNRTKPLAQAKEFVAENVDFPAALAKDRFNPGDVVSVDEVPAGEGRLLRSGGSMLAVYKDASGAVSACSAVCTHLGCYVHWNNAESSWDCPCHGSRFEPNGKVLNGPATRPLETATVKNDAEIAVDERDPRHGIS